MLDQPIRMHVRGSSSAVEYAKKSFSMDPVDQISDFVKSDTMEIPLLGELDALAYVPTACGHGSSLRLLNRPGEASWCQHMRAHSSAPILCLPSSFPPHLPPPCTGLPKGKNWVLHGPENDRTLGMRNWLGYNMARWMGRYASRTQYFELFLNTVRALVRCGGHAACRPADRGCWV